MSITNAEHLWDTQAYPLPCIDVDELMRDCRRVVVVAPHPDDETLGVGGLLSVLLQHDFPIDVVMVTDGEACRSAQDQWAPDVMRSVRSLESVLALRQLGWTRPQTHRLRLPDGDVAAHEETLAQRLEPLLHSGDCVLTTWQHDGHPDHEATARVVMRVAADKECECVQFPVWRRSRMLLDDDGLTREHLRRFNFDSSALRRKRRALKRYRSQLVAGVDNGAMPVVPPAMVDEFLVPFEVLML